MPSLSTHGPGLILYRISAVSAKLSASAESCAAAPARAVSSKPRKISLASSRVRVTQTRE